MSGAERGPEDAGVPPADPEPRLLSLSARDLPGQTHRTPSPDLRVRAAAAVLAGDPVGAVAARFDVDPGQLLRWAEGLAAGGTSAVGGLGVDRPAVGPWASAVPVEDYLAVVMHELRTPLTAARAGLKVLARGDLDPEVRSQVAGTVLARLAGMDRLCQDVLDTVAVATGRSALEPERLDLAAVVREVCSLEGVAFPRRLPFVVDADPRRLQQALAALLGHVLRYAAPADQQVTLQVVAGAALLTFRADGVRLTAQEAAALFEPFGSAARGDGNGLALYVVRTLVVASGGQVGVAGAADGDADATVFWVRLPLAP
jgi:signal transduction histidine kinase